MPHTTLAVNAKPTLEMIIKHANDHNLSLVQLGAFARIAAHVPSSREPAKLQNKDWAALLHISLSQFNRLLRALVDRGALVDTDSLQGRYAWRGSRSYRVTKP